MNEGADDEGVRDHQCSRMGILGWLCSLDKQHVNMAHCRKFRRGNIEERVKPDEWQARTTQSVDVDTGKIAGAASESHRSPGTDLAREDGADALDDNSERP